jgi:hypothetical protein
VIDDPEEVPSHPLHEYTRLDFSWAGDFDMGDQKEGAWVRAVIPNVFGYAPLHVADGRWFLLDAAFVAVLLDDGGRGVAYPFVCTDLGLVFSHAGPEPPMQDRIAEAFWRLLLTEAENRLSEFVAERVAFDTGDGYDTELEIGYSRGQFYAYDLRQPGEE